MRKLPTKKSGRQSKTVSPAPVTRWWKQAWGKISIGTLLAIIGLIYTYKTNGAQDLRTQIYQPVFTDFTILEQSVQAVSLESPTIKTLPGLIGSGALERIPSGLRERILKANEDVNEMNAAVSQVTDVILREVSSRIMKIRTEEIDRDWLQRASAQLRAQSESGKGISDAAIFTLKAHSSRSPGVDIRDPKHPIISIPGGPGFFLNDWLEYPKTLPEIEKMWSDLEYLYFNERADAWYYHITREDLRRSQITLTQFSHPIYEQLKRDPNFEKLLTRRLAVLAEVRSIKGDVIDRIREPKRITDLFNR
jgi:hypothetical protein